MRRFIPPQHGAWAMLLVPWLAGIIWAGFRWLHLPLLAAWLSGYLFAYFALQAVKTGRPGRVRAQMLAYGGPAALAGGVVLAMRPQLLAYAPAYALLLAVNVVYARRRTERALVNDLASVAQSCLMVFVCASIAAVPLGHVLPAFVAVAAYFTGTVLYVKTMIRERDSAAYYRASVGYHGAALVPFVWLGLPLVPVFVLLLARAIVLPRRQLSPKRVGLIEIVACLVLLTAIGVA